MSVKFATKLLYCCLKKNRLFNVLQIMLYQLGVRLTTAVFALLKKLLNAGDSRYGILNWVKRPLYFTGGRRQYCHSCSMDNCGIGTGNPGRFC